VDPLDVSRELQGPLYNPDHQHLEFATLGVLWTNVTYRNSSGGSSAKLKTRRATPAARGRRASANSSSSSGSRAVPDFIITLYAPRLAAFDDRSFCAIIEHELYHCAQATMDTARRASTAMARPMYAIRGHDVEEFFGVAAATACR
jgi:hypothetical protein